MSETFSPHPERLAHKEFAETYAPLLAKPIIHIDPAYLYSPDTRDATRALDARRKADEALVHSFLLTQTLSEIDPSGMDNLDIPLAHLSQSLEEFTKKYTELVLFSFVCSKVLFNVAGSWLTLTNLPLGVLLYICEKGSDATVLKYLYKHNELVRRKADQTGAAIRYVTYPVIQPVKKEIKRALKWHFERQFKREFEKIEHLSFNSKSALSPT